MKLFICKISVSVTGIADVYIDTETDGGCVLFNESMIIPPHIIIGINSIIWANVVDTLHHEILEITAADMGIRFKKTDQIGDGKLLFVANHDEFVEWSLRTTTAFLQALPFLDKAWKKYNNQKLKNNIQGLPNRKRIIKTKNK